MATPAHSGEYRDLLIENYETPTQNYDASKVVSTVPAGDRPQRRARLHHAGARRRSLRHLRRGVPAQRRGQLRQRALGGGAEGLLIP